MLQVGADAGVAARTRKIAPMRIMTSILPQRGIGSIRFILLAPARRTGIFTGLMSPLNLKKASRKRGRPKVEGLPERRREEILAVATEEFARRGYPGTDLQAVADRLGVGKGTVYRYFETKEALFLAAADRSMRLLKDECERAAAAGSDAFERIALATRAYLRFYDRGPEFIEIMIQERAEFRDRKRHTYFLHHEANIGPWNDLFRELI